ncbi:MAG TPA: hypothetical protein VN673_01535 [Clostridia bacterium]|nr:hypothetical protein [Clostridia bacterium]
MKLVFTLYIGIMGMMIKQPSQVKDEDAIAIDEHLNAIREIVTRKRSTQLSVWFTATRRHFNETMFWKDALKASGK